MQRVFIIVMVFMILGFGIKTAWPQNPFTSRPETCQKAPEPPFKSRFFVKIVLWQHQLKQKMSELIRVSRNNGSLKPLLLLMGMAFLYGAIHAAGPGHGKVIALSYVLSHKTSVAGGFLLGFFIAVIHGSSGVVGVLGLRYIIQRSVSETLITVTGVTQIVSFGLITVLGLGILLTNIYRWLSASRPGQELRPLETTRTGLLPWAAAIGLVPCPAVVMVMLFCISMEAVLLGLVLAASLSLGMAATISCVVIAAVLGKMGIFSAISEKRAGKISLCLGIVSGAAIAVFGTIFLIAAINVTLY